MVKRTSPKETPGIIINPIFRGSKFAQGLLIWIGLAITFEVFSLHGWTFTKLLGNNEVDGELLFAAPQTTTTTTAVTSSSSSSSSSRSLTTSQSAIIDTNDLPPIKPYYELHDKIHKWASSLNEFGRHRKRTTSAYNEATVVTHARWFKKRKQCRTHAGCCVETMAISLEQDEKKLVNTGDGKDLADLMLEFARRPETHYLKYHATSLKPEYLACLVPGTAIYLENDHKLLTYFWNTLRPKIMVPYALVVAGTDSNTPGWMSMKYLKEDPLLIKLYGTNPNITASEAALNKYTPIHLGLSRVYPQEKYLSHYHYMNHHQNPFGDKAKWDFSKQPLDFDEDVFVHFGLRLNHRRQLWQSLCNNTQSGAGELSCHQETEKHTVNDIYTSMSKYRFGISPSGRGWDCYRTYELLLLGIIPIVDDRRHIGSNLLLDGLPVIQMKMFNSTTGNMRDPKTKQQFIQAIQDYIASDEFQNTDFDKGWKKLFFEYTRKQFLRDTGRDKEILKDKYGNDYYLAYKYTLVGPKAHDDKHTKETFCSDKRSCLVPGGKVNDAWLTNPKKLGDKDKEYIKIINEFWKGKKEKKKD